MRESTSRGRRYHAPMSFLIGVVVVAACGVASPAVVSSNGEASDVASTVQLEDPPLSPALEGSVLLIERNDGVFVQGVVVLANAARLVVDTDEVARESIKKIRTLAPVGQPIALSRDVRAFTSDGKMVRGRV